GDLVAAVDHLAASIADPAVAETATELLALGEDDPEFPTHVTALLEGVRILTAATSEGDTQTAREARAAVRLLGTQVAEEARQRPNESGSGENNGPPDHAGPPEDVPTGPPEDVPGATAPGQVDRKSTRRTPVT